MKIACLGWGSLIWNPDHLPICTEWRTDGPTLPVEFTRQSKDGRMTLAITSNAEAIPVLWAELDVRSLDEARLALADREGIRLALIEISVGVWSANYESDHAEARVIGEWAIVAGVAGVVWTALKPRFAGKPIGPSCDQVIRHLKTLEGEARHLAEKYIRYTPAQIRTPYRAAIERELGWTPRSP
jgi:hypothetical protein